MRCRRRRSAPATGAEGVDVAKDGTTTATVLDPTSSGEAHRDPHQHRRDDHDGRRPATFYLRSTVPGCHRRARRRGHHRLAVPTGRRLYRSSSRWCRPASRSSSRARPWPCVRRHPKTCIQADVVKPRSQPQNHRYLGVKPGFGRRSGIYLISGCLDDFQMGFGSMAGAFGKAILARRSPSMSFRLATIR